MMAVNNIVKHIINKTRSISIGIICTCLLLESFVSSTPQRGGNKDTCQIDADCQKGGQTNRCCSQFYFCGTGPDYCAEGCTFEDVEFIGGDLSKAQGGGGVKIPYDDECIIACENNPRCQFFTYDYATQRCYLKSSLGEKRDIAEKGKVLSGGLDKDNCEPELKCEPPYKKVNLQCVLVPEEDENKTKDRTKKSSFPKTVETCHIFEGALPTYLLSNAQLNPSGIPKKEFPNTLLQGDLAPDLFGIRSRRSADYTQEDPLEIEECFVDPAEIEIKYERKLVSNRLRQYESQSCYDDVIITGISEDLVGNNGNQSAKLQIREGRQSTSSFQEEPIYTAFPNLNSRPVTDRWSWLNYPQRDDGMCVATLPGFAGKYRLFPCDTELYMVCERRNPSYSRPSPPIIKKIPTRRIDANDNRNSFVGSNQTPSFGVGAGTISNVGNRGSGLTPVGTDFSLGKGGPGFTQVGTDFSFGKGGRGFTQVGTDFSLPRPVDPQSTFSVNTGSNRPVVSIPEDGLVGLPMRKNPFIQLHDKIADIMTRRRLLYALTGRRVD